MQATAKSAFWCVALEAGPASVRDSNNRWMDVGALAARLDCAIRTTIDMARVTIERHAGELVVDDNLLRSTH
jgi:hypothetical protein